MKRNILMTLAALCAAMAYAERTVYLESFDNIGDKVACFNDGTRVSEGESGGLKVMRFAPKATGQARRGFFNISEPPAAKEWTLSFGFNFGGGNYAHAFSLELYFGDRAATEVRTLQIADAGARFGAGPLPTPADGAEGLLPAGNWNTAALTVRGGRASLHLRRGGVLSVACEGELPASPLVGWNLSMADNRLPGAKPDECCGSVSVRLFRVIDGAARPFAPGDPDEWLPELAAAGRDAMPADFGEPLSNKVVRAVDLDANDVEFKLRLTPPAAARNARFALNFISGTNKPPVVALSPQNEKIEIARRRYCAAGGAFSNATENVVLTNQCLGAGGIGVLSRTAVYVRPPIRRRHRYRQPEVNQIYAAYGTLPALEDHVFDLVLRKTGDNAYTLWLDGNVLSAFSTSEPVTAIRAESTAGLADLRVRDVPARKQSRIYELPFGKWKDGFRLSRVRENQGTYALECNGYLSRSAFDAMPSSCLFAVPNRQYVRARALCRVDDKAPEDFVPEITARLTQFYANGGRSEAMCQKTVRLPAPGEDGPLPEGVVRKGRDLYEVTFDLDVGFIMDMNFMEDAMARVLLNHLDFEFTGTLWDRNRYYLDKGRAPSAIRQSSVIVLSGSLEESPARFFVKANRKYGLYYPDEHPGATVEVTPLEPGTYTVETVVRDDDGKVVQRDGFKTDKPVSREVRFSERAYGHYYVDFTLRDAAGRRIVGHEAAYANIPPDTRKAGYESPYYCWNFRGSHGTPRTMEEWGEAYRRIGIRRTLLDTDANCETNPAIAALGLTQAQFRYNRGGRKSKEGEEDFRKRKVREFRHLREIFPHCRTALLFHESGGGPFPKELYGGKTDVTPAVAAADSNRVATAVAYAKLWREADPSVRLIIGNSGSSEGLIAQLLRGGFPREYLDSLGEESVGMTQPPELTTALAPWKLKEIARIFGYGDVPADCPFEWKSRARRYYQRRDQYAEVCQRDALIAHALRYTTIPMSAGCPAANSYFDTIWGTASAFTRWPLAYPTPLAAANATLTLVLDSARFVRMVPTGSHTVYCLEFEKEGGFIYAFWSARGEAPFDMKFEGNAVLVGMCGEELGRVGDKPLAAREAPQYAIAERKIVSAAAAHSRDFPHERYAGSEKAVVAAALDDVSRCVLDTTQDPRIEIPFDNTPRRPGAFAIRTVEDAEKGPCVEIEHLSATNCPALMMEYAWLRFPGAKPVEGRPTTIGALVKGNSSWDKLFFEFRDAEGETWLSVGSGGYGCDVYDWPAQNALNFDGWHFVQFPLTGDSPVKIHAPGDNQWQWVRDCESGNGRIDYPVTATGLCLGARSQVLDILEMKPVKDPVRIKAVMAY